MLPTQGQGASQAIEDSEALGEFFEDITEKPSIEKISSMFAVCPEQTLDIKQYVTNE